MCSECKQNLFEAELLEMLYYRQWEKLILYPEETAVLNTLCLYIPDIQVDTRMDTRMDRYTYLSKSPAATSGLGRRMGKSLKAGSVIALIGELGCGKTLLTRGICSGHLTIFEKRKLKAISKRMRESGRVH